jgi:hypothetical protein
LLREKQTAIDFDGGRRIAPSSAAGRGRKDSKPQRGGKLHSPQVGKDDTLNGSRIASKTVNNKMICFLPPDGVSCADGFIGKEIADASKGHA